MGFSIPRDDVVNFPHATLDGLTEGKIDAAYDYAYNQYCRRQQRQDEPQRVYLAANQAGQLFEIQTVESVTGVHIDHFAESNIIGFYYLAQQFGGMEVCIKPAPAQGGFPAGANLTDIDTLVDPPTNNSGFNAYKDGYNRKKGGAQYLHLSPAQSLAYVRSRDTLPGVDIGRTARQQAAIDYVIWKLKTEGVLSDIGAITSLLSTAKDYLITDSGWDLPDFATDMSALTGKNLSFTTLASAPTNDVQVPGLPESAERELHRRAADPARGQQGLLREQVRDGNGGAAGLVRDRRRLQRQRRVRVGRPGRAGPRRDGLQGPRGRELVVAVAAGRG